MKLDFHVLTVFPPHNVNRDEDGRPKTALFGNVLRGRISSQSKKKAMRLSPHFADLQRATRTREAGIKVYRALKDAGVEDQALRVLAARAVNHALGGGGTAPDLKSVRKDLKEFDGKEKKAIEKAMGEHALDEAAAREHALERWLRSGQGLVISTKEFAGLDAWTQAFAEACKSGGKDAEEADERCRAICDGGLLAPADLDEDTALFGRMVAANPEFNVDASCMVSHAVTTHRFGVEGDYFSAGEELNVLKEKGAAITSYAFFGSGVYYQHAVLDVSHLLDGLNGDVERTRTAALAFLDGLVAAQPTGKRNSHGSDVLASYVLCGRGVAPSFNAMLAFLKPVEADDGDLLKASARELLDFYEVTRSAYGLDTDYRVFTAAPSLRSGNAPKAPEVWDIADLRAFVADACTPALA